MSKPVVIVGAGLSGLACARTLERSGIPVIVLERDSAVGGRLATRRVDGFTLDRGFQVFFTAYPSAAEELEYGKLDFRKFAPGALIWDGNHLQEVDGSNPLGLAFSGFLSLSDKVNLADWTLDLMGMSLAQISREPDMPAERALRQKGLSPEFLDRFARPFLGGVFMDRSLQFSRRALDFVWKMLVSGDTVVPASGMEQIPLQLAEGIDVRLGTRVVALVGDCRVRGVVLEDGSSLEAEVVVVATDSDTAADLSGFATPRTWRSQVCLHFEAPEPPVEAPLIVLTTEDALVHMVVPMTQVAPEYGPGGRHLVNVTCLGLPDLNDTDLAQACLGQVASWFPGKGVAGWRLLGVDRIPKAQLAQPVGFQSYLAPMTPGRDGLYLAGEFTRGSSINGAIASGKECARLIVEDLLGVGA